MGEFLDRYQLPKLNLDLVKLLSNPITPNKIETVIKMLTIQTRQGHLVLV